MQDTKKEYKQLCASRLRLMPVPTPLTPLGGGASHPIQAVLAHKATTYLRGDLGLLGPCWSCQQPVRALVSAELGW
ncbi:hypothetical protein N7517_004576 [Penicillium concentricum]|uniref:Uncharacterized protein n=1 Tax=Penicillium concentricum TaxID=293559 RepID=A0A9W9S731_9EURO|nr:uncharacterized protein N7517_004576 [Penicillium concentricum]KAJ5372570.1 hypothetical protein N7517_004576 [Penicillium concentricum]